MNAISVTGAATLLRTVVQHIAPVVGGRRELQVVVVLGAVLALEAADTAAVGAAGPQLQHSMSIGKAELGLLLAVTALVGAVATLPAGMVVDRFTRVRLLAGGVALWAVATGVAALATGFVFLLVARIGLGIVVAIAPPATASLIGDSFDAADRGRIYSYVLAGELVGSGFGFIVCGDLATWSWRASFAALAPPAVVLAFAVRRLPEPKRAPTTATRAGDDMPLWQAVGHVLRIRSNVVLILSSAFAYFFLAGVRGFGVEFVRHQYGVAQTVATALVPLVGAGMVVGVLSGGRLADRLHARGVRSARVIVAGATVLVAVAALPAAILTRHLSVALPLLLVTGVGMGATNPPLDAARLDVMPPRLWGRAEGVRAVLQSGAQAAAALLFGYVAGNLFGSGDGLRNTFLLSLVPLAGSAAVLLTMGRRAYPADAARARRQVSGRGSA